MYTKTNIYIYICTNVLLASAAISKQLNFKIVCVSLVISIERRQSNMAGMLDKQGFVYNNKINSRVCV